MVWLGWTNWQREFGLIVVLLGLVVLCFAPGPIIGAMWPVQDITPELAAERAEEMHIALFLLAFGWLVGTGMVVAGVWLIVVGRRISRRAAG